MQQLTRKKEKRNIDQEISLTAINYVQEKSIFEQNPN